jgi:hypothetical protein
LEMKGKGSATYYVPGPVFPVHEGTLVKLGPGLVQNLGEQNTQPPGINTPPPDLKTPVQPLKTPPPDLKTPVQPLKTPPPDLKAPPPVDHAKATADRETLLAVLADDLREQVNGLGRRMADKGALEDLLVQVCRIRAFSKEELAVLFSKREHYLRTKYLNPLVQKGRLAYRYPEVLNHPDQAYVATGK